MPACWISNIRKAEQRDLVAAAGAAHTRRRLPCAFGLKPATLALALHCLIAAPTAAQSGAAGADAAFKKGEALLLANCADCADATAEALKTGLREIERALELGYADGPAAYRLLAEGYGALAFAFAQPGSAEHQRASEAQREAYRRWVEAEPSNTEALYGHAVASDDPSDRRAALERLVQVDPGHLWGQFLLGEIEIGSVASRNGFDRMQQAFDASDGADKREFGERLIEAYERHGLAAEAQSVRDQLAAMSFGP